MLISVINRYVGFVPQKNTCILPEDLRDFYLTTDGFALTWSVKLDSRCLLIFCYSYKNHNIFSSSSGSFFTVWFCVCLPDECVPLGCMMINSVSRLCPLLQPVSLFCLPNAPSLADLDWEESSKESGKHLLVRSWCGFDSTITTCRFQLCLLVCAYLCRKEANEWTVGWKVNICTSIISVFCQDWSVCPLRLILTPGAASSSSMLVVGMEKCVLFTKRALQVLHFYSHTLHFTSWQHVYIFCL